MTAPLIWLLAAALSVTSPHPWNGPAPLIAMSPPRPVAHSTLTVVASKLPTGVTSASVLAGSAEQPMRRLNESIYRASFLAPQAGPLVVTLHFWRRGTLYEVPGGTVLVRPKQ